MAFINDVVDLYYNLQSFMYTLGRSLHEGSGRPPDFIFIAAEYEARHSVHEITSRTNYLENGAKKFQ